MLNEKKITNETKDKIICVFACFLLKTLLLIATYKRYVNLHKSFVKPE